MPSVDNFLRGFFIYFFLQRFIMFYNIYQNMTDVVFTSLLTIHFNRGANCRRRNGQHLTNHPVGARELRTEPHERNVFIRYTPKYFQNDFGCQMHCNTFLRTGTRTCFRATPGATPGTGTSTGFFCFIAFPFRNNRCDILFFDSFGLQAPASVVCVITTSLNLTAILKNTTPPFVRFHIHKSAIRLFVYKKFATLDAHTTQYFSNRSQILDIEYRSRQLNMSKVSWRLHIV